MTGAKKCARRLSAGHLDLNSNFSESVDDLLDYEQQSFEIFDHTFRDSIVASIPACHAGDRGSIPRRGVNKLFGQLSQW